MLMENLKKLIHDNPMILSERPQFRLLYQELNCINQALFSIHEDHHHNPEKVRNLKRRFKDAAEEAQDIIDLYLSVVAVDFSNRELSPTSDVFETSLDLGKVMRSIESIKEELITINIDDLKMDSSPRIDTLKTHSSVAAAAAAGTSSTKKPSEKKPLMEETVVGLDGHVKLIWDKLNENTTQLGFISIVGMGGLGKTTLATKVFENHTVVSHFKVRALATVSQTYNKRDFLIQILKSIGGQQDLEKENESELHHKVHQQLMRRKYLIVIDDIWSTEAWDEMKVFFHDDNTASRILLTTRNNEVALHVKSDGFVHKLPCLKDEESWELLKQKVFHGDECPEWLIEPGRQIARKCQGLPLSLVVMAGVLAKQPMKKDMWEEIACSFSSYHKGNMEALALSFDYLPVHLRECFLYLGGFPEDFELVTEKLTWLWVAEGFIEEVENRSLEDTAKGYLIDLIERNLVIVAKRNEIGDVKACNLHDLVRELCLKKAKDEKFFLKMDYQRLSSQLLDQQRRLFINKYIDTGDDTRLGNQTIRSVLCFAEHLDSVDFIARSFVILRVLDLQKCLLDDFPDGLELPVHLRYLAIWYSSKFPDSICQLLSLETLILKTRRDTTHLPPNITDLVNLKHLWSNNLLYLPYTGRPMKLHSISNVEFIGKVDSFQNCFPDIKKLALSCGKNDEYHFELLPYLEILKLMGLVLRQNGILLPATLRKLTLERCFLPWSKMSIIQSLPNLEVLKLKGNAFTGRRWNAHKQRFQQLKLLTLQSLGIKHWEASTESFPCLKKLSLSGCYNLKKVPLKIGKIATLELIETDSSSSSVVKSVKRIQDADEECELKVTVDGMELSLYLAHSELE